MKKIIFVTDTWTDNINGVVTSLLKTKQGLEAKGFEVAVMHPANFISIPLPTYSEIRLAISSKSKIDNLIKKENPDYIHIATEGPLGLAVRQACIRNNWRFTSSYHTRLPDYIQMRLKMFYGLTYKYLRWFHSVSDGVFVSTRSLKDELEARKFTNVVEVPLGVDMDFFKKNPHAKIPLGLGLKTPIFVFLGRVAPEKNIEAFLDCKLPGSKLIIGDGPQRKSLESKYKGEAVFVGYKSGQELIDLLSIASVFVCPSKTETFGLVMVEALSCGLPVAAYDVPGPKDIITSGVNGFLGDDLEMNVKKCLTLNSNDCRNSVSKFTWEKHAENFIKNLIPINSKLADNNAKVSCIVPAYNEGSRIGRVLDAISSHELIDEIIVINDGSTDDTQAVLGGRTDIRVISFDKNRGKSHAVMHGLKSAKNDIIMTIDSDLIGLSKKDLTALMEPVLHGHVDKTLTLRKNSLLIFKLFNLDFISGERVFRKSLIDNLDDIGNLESFQLESFFNNIIIKKKLRLKSIKWHGVITPRKSVKMGFWKGNIGDLKMIFQIVSFLGVRGTAKQFMSMYILKK